MCCRAAIVLLLVATGCRSPGAAPIRGAVVGDAAIASPPPLPALPPYEEPRPVKVDTSSWPPVSKLSPVVRYERPLRTIRDAGSKSGFVVANSESEFLIFARRGPAPIGNFPYKLDVPGAFAAGAGEAGVQMLYFAPEPDKLVARELPSGSVRFVVPTPSCDISPTPFEIPGGVLLGARRIDADGRVRWRTDQTVPACVKPLGLVGERAIFLPGERAAEVTALDLRDGRPIWQSTVEHEVGAATLLGPVIVTVEATERAPGWGRVATALTALDATTGAKRWTIPLARSEIPELSGASKSVLLRTRLGSEAGGAPNRLEREPIVVFDRDTGKEVFRAPDSTFAWLDPDGTTVYVGEPKEPGSWETRSYVVAYSLPDGRREWRTASPIVASPDPDRFFDGDTVFVCDPRDGVLRGLRRATGKVEWSRATGIWHTGNCKVAVDRPDPNGPLEFLVPAEVTPESPRGLPFVRLARKKDRGA